MWSCCLQEFSVKKERKLIVRSKLEMKNHRRVPAAKLGIPRSTLDSKIRSLKINTHRFKTF